LNPQLLGVRNVIELLPHFICDNTAFITELRSVALGLMLLVASAMGSVEYLLGTVDAMSRGKETLAPSVLGILEGEELCNSISSVSDAFSALDLNNIKTELLLSIPTGKVSM
jgi:hypothetical protein